MIKVNLLDWSAVRESIPKALLGLSDDTLRNLQTELHPVPADFVDIEYWPEIAVSQTITNDQKFGDEIFVVNSGDKTVSVSKHVLNKTNAELLADNTIAYNNKQTEITDAFKAAVRTSRSAYAQEEIDSFPEQRAELRDYDDDPLSETLLLDALAVGRGAPKSQVVDRIRTMSRAYKPVYGSILGKKQKLSDDLYAVDVNLAGAIDLINAINW